jgi:hypothetical protein
MTLPTSGPLSLSNVLAELQAANPARSVPISLGDADVLALAGKSSPPISLSDLYGKSSYTPMTVTPHDASASYMTTNSGTATASPSVTVTNGSGGYSYAWSFASNPNSMSISGVSNGSSVLVQKTFVKNQQGTYSAVMQCVVTDNTGHSVTVQTNVEITLDF